MLPSIQIPKKRLTEELDRLAEFSDAPSPAVTRIHFTQTDLAARAYIRQLCRDAQLAIREDAVGNIFARWPGEFPDLPAVATGSHIDAIPFSGRYDGTVGVLGGLEALRALRASGFVPRRSLELVLFTAEEPTRFGLGCLGSRALAGVLDPNSLRALQDGEGRGFEEVRREAGYVDDLDAVRIAPGAYHSFVELHIEQGSRLEAAGLPIGVVRSIAAPATLRVTLYGEGGHAGTRLMAQRRDALVAASEIVLAVEKAAATTGRIDSVATVGSLTVHPGAVNSIPSRVILEIDIRDTSQAPRDGMVAYIRATINGVAARRQVRVEVDILNADAPSQSGDLPLEAVVAACNHLHHQYLDLVSRAYHDTLFMSLICPTAMIFIPSKGGHSHRPEEYSSPDQICRGVETLALTLARLSQS